jgi:hypothetical protein
VEEKGRSEDKWIRQSLKLKLYISFWAHTIGNGSFQASVYVKPEEHAVKEVIQTKRLPHTINRS